MSVATLFKYFVGNERAILDIGDTKHALSPIQNKSGQDGRWRWQSGGRGIEIVAVTLRRDEPFTRYATLSLGLVTLRRVAREAHHGGA